MPHPEHCKPNCSAAASPRPTTKIDARIAVPSGEAAVGSDFRRLADTVSDLVLVLSSAGTPTLLNRAGRAMLGVSAEVDRLPSAEDLLADDERALLYACLADERTSGVLGEVRFRRLTGGIDLPLMCRLVRLEGAGDEGSVAVVGAGTGGAAYDASLDLPSEMAAPTRMVELLAGVVGHDLRNPLHAMLTCAHMVLRQSETPGAQGAMKRIISSGHRMQRMIDQLLDLTRLRAGGGILLRPRPADLQSVVEQVAREIRIAHPDWPFTVDAIGNVRGTWDTDRIAQGISNLLGNAVQHGVREGGVRIVIDGTAKESVTLAVQNRGSVPPDLLPVIFNPFRGVVRGRHGANGLGLGLYITRQIALAHGGDVGVQSDDASSTFTIAVPREAGAEPQRALPGVAPLDPGMDALSRTGPTASTTARLFGAPALHERAPQEYWLIVERYGQALDQALERQTYRDLPDSSSEELRALADTLGALGAGAREIAELHGRVLRLHTREASSGKSQALTNEGRMVAFELMGHLLSYYRRRAGLAQKGP